MASAVTHVTKVDAPDPNTVVFHYDTAVGNVLPAISGLYMLPKHMWEKYTGNNGKDLKTFLPENHLPIVSGGPFQMTQYQKKGTSVFKPNPGFWGDKPHVDAAALVYYTNSDSMIADLKSGQISAVDQVPYTTVNALKIGERPQADRLSLRRVHQHHLELEPVQAAEPRAARPAGEEGAVDVRGSQQIIYVIYQGNAELANQSILGPFGATGRARTTRSSSTTATRPTRCSTSSATRRGPTYPRGACHHRPVRPAGAQDVVPDHGAGSLDFNGDREYQIVPTASSSGRQGDGAGRWRRHRGIRDRDGQHLRRVEEEGYSKFDIALWDWFSYPDPDFQLSVATTGQWCSWSDTGYSNPAYDQMYSKQGTLVDPAQRKTLVQQMDKLISDQWIYTYLVNEKGISAQTLGWGGFRPVLAGYNYHYLTDPYQVG